MNYNNLNIYNDHALDSNSNIKLHIKYDDSLKLKDLASCLDSINKAINDINRSTIKSNSTLGMKYAPRIASVESGSIIINMIVPLASSVAMSVLANFIYDRMVNKKRNSNSINMHGKNNSIKLLTQNDRKNTYQPICMNVHGENNQIEIIISNNIK